MSLTAAVVHAAVLAGSLLASLSPQDADLLADSRAALAAGTEEPGVLAIHASRLLDAGAVESLGPLLVQGPEASALAVMQALKASARPVLLVELVTAATSSAAPVAAAAREHVEHLAMHRTEVVDELVAALRDDELGTERRRTIVRVLGGSRQLAAVAPLIEQLEGPLAPAADEALESLTGHAVDGDPAASWAAFWAEHEGTRRDVLMELALERERTEREVEREAQAARLAALRAEVVATRTREVGDQVDRLRAALSDDYREVRLVAAERLATHANPEQAAAAVPALLERLGTEPAGERPEGSNGRPPTRETDPEVRAALVRALGALGRGDVTVRGVLLAALRSADDAMASAAVEALARVRDDPAVVAPLLAFLERGGVAESTAVTVFDIVSRNQPSGVMDALHRHLDRAGAPALRAAIVRAILASDELDRALELVGPLAAGEEDRDVRYGMALGLGERVLDLPRDDASRGIMVELLGRLVADRDPSVRAEAATSLGETRESSAIGLLEARCRVESDPGVLVRLLGALGEVGLPDGVDAIGRVAVAHAGSDSVAEGARQAVRAIGGDDAALWLAMSRTLREVGAHALSAWTLRETLRRFEDRPEQFDLLARARGELAEVLWLAGDVEASHELLVQLRAAEAPYPVEGTALDLLAATAEQLGRPGEAADWLLLRLGSLDEGEGRRAEVRHAAARNLMAAARHAEALEHVQALHEDDPANNEVMFWLGQARMALGEDDAARETFVRLLERVADGEAALRAEVLTALDTLASSAGADPVPDAEDGGAEGTGDGPAGAGDGASGQEGAGRDAGPDEAPAGRS